MVMYNGDVRGGVSMVMYVLLGAAERTRVIMAGCLGAGDRRARLPSEDVAVMSKSQLTRRNKVCNTHTHTLQ